MCPEPPHEGPEGLGQARLSAVVQRDPGRFEQFHELLGRGGAAPPPQLPPLQLACYAVAPPEGINVVAERVDVTSRALVYNASQDDAVTEAVCPEPSIKATRLVTPPAVERLLNIYAMKREMWAGMRPARGRSTARAEELMLYPSFVRLLGISVFGLPSSAQTTFISSVRGILPSGLRLSSTSGLWSWESAMVRFLACVERAPYSGPGEFSMWEAEAFIGRLVDFGGLMATGGYPLPRSVA